MVYGSTGIWLYGAHGGVCAYVLKHGVWRMAYDMYIGAIFMLWHIWRRCLAYSVAYGVWRKKWRIGARLYGVWLYGVAAYGTRHEHMVAYGMYMAAFQMAYGSLPSAGFPPPSLPAAWRGR
jgi:hypothetical protein